MPVEIAPVSTAADDKAVSDLRMIKRGVWFIFIIIVLSCMYYARDFFVPLLLALLVYFTLAGPVRYFSGLGIPPAVSACILVILMLGGLALLAITLSGSVMEAVDEMPSVIEKVKTALTHWTSSLGHVTEVARTLESLGAQHVNSAQEVVTTPPGLLALAASSATRFIATFAVTIILVIFLLSSGDMFLQKLVRISPRLSDKKRAVQIVRDIQIEVSHYLLTITVINATLGAVVAAAMFQLGMPQPLLLGVVAAGLNFIPYAGALLMAVILAFLSFATTGPVLASVVPPAVYLALHVTESGFVSPLVLGKRLRLNAAAVFTAIAFWGWMWGLIGALMAVPILVIIKIFGDHLDSMRVLAEFLSDESTGEASASPAPVVTEEKLSKPA